MFKMLLKWFDIIGVNHAQRDVDRILEESRRMSLMRICEIKWLREE
jgi:hypothetical protein